jgi:putative serine protease PepD
MTTTPEGPRPADDAAAPQPTTPTERVEVPAADATAATQAVPAAETTAAPQAQDAPTQRITADETRPLPTAPQAAAPHPAYPAPYQHGAPQAAPAPQQPRYGQLAPQQPAPPQYAAPQHQPYAGPQPTAPQPVAPHAAAPHAAAPQQPGQHDPLAAFRAPAAGGAGQPPAGGPEHPAPFGPPAPEGAPRKERNKLWIPVVSAAAAAALLGGIGGATLVNALDGGSSSGTRAADISSIGRAENDAVPVSGSSAENPDWQAVASAVQASVVAIQVTTSSGGAEGSGVIVDTDGHIVTNNHVVSGAENDQVQVTLTDGRIFTADVVGTDPTTDLAVIQLQDAPDDLSAATFGDASEDTVGDPVMAVGNPLGLANTVTTGIVSALDRPVSTTESGASEAVVTNAIQIDAAINPGNSGGPLFDAQGRVIGITSSIATTSSESGSIGLGFAIPVNVADMIASQLIQDGSAEHAFLGVGLSDATATADGVTRAGASVQSVSDGSPAADAGLEQGDVIVAIDGKAVAGAESLTGYVRAHASGDEVTLTVVRDGKSLDVDVTLATREETSTSGSGQGSGDQGQQGGQQAPGGLENMTPEQLWEWFQQQQQGGGQG